MKDISAIKNKQYLPILHDLRKEIKSILGEKLKEIILFGSYSRNEESYDSDMDILILIDDIDENISKYRSDLSEIRLQLSLKYDVLISLIIKSYNYYSKYSNVLPFYSVIQDQGIEIYGG